MVSVLLSNRNEKICVVRLQDNLRHLVYRLEGMQDYSFNFYVPHTFELALNQNLPLSEQPYGLLGSCADITGRMIGPQKERVLVSRSGNRIITLEQPVYSLIGEYDESELQRVLKGFSLEESDLPYASLSVSSIGGGEGNVDFYINTLFFMAGGYGILTETSAVAGRSIEDCCSPEFYYKTYKVRLDENPLTRHQSKDMVPDAVPSCWTLSANPEIIKPAEVKSGDAPEKINEFDRQIDELFATLLLSPESILQRSRI